MAQQIIDVGNVANDGQGDPLRTAFIKTNQNFTELYNAGGISGIANGTSNITIAENGPIAMAVAGTDDILTVSVTGATVQGTLVGNTVCAVGNVHASYLYGNGTFITGINNINANFLTGTTLSSNVTNSSLTNFGLISGMSVSGNVSVSGNITTANRVTAANITSNGTLGVGSSATFGAGITANGTISTTGNVVANNIIGTFVFASISTTGDIQGGNLLTNGLISAAGNVTGNYILGNGSLLTGIGSAYSNANVAAYLPTYTGALTASTLSLSGNILSNINTSANITGSYYFGNGSQLTGVLATGIGVLPSLSVTGNAEIGNIYTTGRLDAGPTFVGSLSLAGNLLSVLQSTSNVTTSANVNTGNLLVTGTMSMLGNIEMPGGNINDAIYISADYYLGTSLELEDHVWVGTDNTSGTPPGNVIWSAGNVTANAYLNGNNLIVINSANIGTTVSAAGNILTSSAVSATGNVIGGNLTTAGRVSTSGNVIANNISVTNFATISGNATVGNLSAAELISAAGNIVTAGYFVGNLIGNTTGNFVVPGANTEVLFNLNGNAGASANFTFDSSDNSLLVAGPIFADGEIEVDSYISAAGNITANAASFFIGNGSQLTGIVATVIGVVPTLSVTGNIDTGNLRTAGLVTATGNITTAGNLNTGGLSLSGNVLSNIVTSANVTAGNINVLGNIDLGTGNINLDTANIVNALSVLSEAFYGNFAEIESYVWVGSGPGNVIWSAGNITANGNLNSQSATVTTMLVAGNIVSNGNVDIEQLNANNIAANLVGGNQGEFEDYVHVGLTPTSGSPPGNIIWSAANVTAAGNLNGNNLSVSNIASISGNVTAGNITTGGLITAAGDVTAGNVISSGLISASGNVAGNNVAATGGLVVLASLAADPPGVTGAMYFYTGNSKFRGYNGTSWVDLS